jgi:signal transduction histidine kinase
MSPAWFWISVRAASPGWFVKRPWLIGLAFVVPLLIYSCLYWDRSVRFVAWDTPVPTHGPWFDYFISYQHIVTALGAYYFARAGIRLGRSNMRIMLALLLGVALPLAANLSYYIGATQADWTVVALGPAGILIWIAIIHSGFASNLPTDRNEVIDQLDVGVIVADASERILSVNPAAENLTDLAQLRGHSISGALAATERRTDAVIESRRIDLRGPLGVIGHALILTDRTETELTRRQLELKGRLEAIGSLTAGIAHEINNPLCYVQANLSMFEAVAKELATPDVKKDLEPFLRELVDDLGMMAAETQDGVERIRLLVQRLGTFSRAPDLSVSAQPIDLGKCVRQAAAVAAVGRTPDPIRVAGRWASRSSVTKHPSSRFSSTCS